MKSQMEHMEASMTDITAIETVALSAFSTVTPEDF